MSLRQISEVIQRIEYSEGVKTRLLEELDDYLYEEHKSFLSNPLLATIMLLTYDHTSSIPTKATSFYRQAFETLYQRHDSSKTEIYRRDHHAGLQMDEFAQLFSVFCYRTFIGAKFEFSSSELLSQFRAAAEYLGMSARPELIMRDAIESVCLLQRDGLSYVFVHRSFQEYFAAVFIKDYRSDSVKEVFDKACDHAHGDNILRMIHEIAPELVDTVYLKPTFDNWIKSHGRSSLTDSENLFMLGSSIMRSFQYSCSTGNISRLTIDEESFGGFLRRVKYVFPEVSFPHDIFEDQKALIEDIAVIVKDKTTLTPALQEISKLGRAKVTVKVPLTNREADWLVLTRLVNRLELVREEVIWFSNVVNERIRGGNRRIRELMRDDI